MNSNTAFDLMVDVSFTIIPQLVVVGTKPYHIINYLILQQGETIQDLHICNLIVRVNIILVKNKTCRKNALTQT